MTRNLESDAAKKLLAKGVEVVRADLNDKRSIKKAVVGSEGVFGVGDLDQFRSTPLNMNSIGYTTLGRHDWWRPHN